MAATAGAVVAVVAVAKAVLLAAWAASHTIDHFQEGGRQRSRGRCREGPRGDGCRDGLLHPRNLKGQTAESNCWSSFRNLKRLVQVGKPWWSDSN